MIINKKRQLITDAHHSYSLLLKKQWKINHFHKTKLTQDVFKGIKKWRYGFPIIIEFGMARNITPHGAKVPYNNLLNGRPFLQIFF